ncbi:alpha/beta-hydrolase [Apiospora marii]|uniref:Alpha/beta-hydrolase n=1 Tax=Apiospora marii TaxID=335849 RepID=A0ABR1RE86_9PEZI
MTSTVALPSKPDATLAYELIPGDDASNLLVVFLNGLGLAQGVWKPTIELFRQSSVSPKPWLLTYDRYSQGASARDPRETWPTKDPGYAHTLDDVTDDLHELIHILSRDRNSRIIFVNNSIGAHVARRYADRYPTVVEGILFLDSNPGNTDYESIWPNPKDPSFNLETMVPPGTARDVYQAAYTKMTTIFSPAAKNPEGFDRREIKNMLPDPSKPKLKGSKTYSDKGPWITVVGHELEQFSKEEWVIMKIPIGMAAMYTQPMWQKYNEGLCLLTDPDRAKGPLIAPGTGHFVQKDNPSFVAKELEELVKKVEGSA